MCESDKETRPPKRKAPHGKKEKGTLHHETHAKVPADAKRKMSLISALDILMKSCRF